jgi:hypothetical protein
MWHVRGENRNAYRISVRKPKKTEHFGDLHADGKIVLKWIIKK